MTTTTIKPIKYIQGVGGGRLGQNSKSSQIPEQKYATAGGTLMVTSVLILHMCTCHCAHDREQLFLYSCAGRTKRLLSLWGYLYFASKKVGWGFYSLPPLGAFYGKPLYFCPFSFHGEN